jgi:hypothetical protein
LLNGSLKAWNQKVSRMDIKKLTLLTISPAFVLNNLCYQFTISSFDALSHLGHLIIPNELVNDGTT